MGALVVVLVAPLLGEDLHLPEGIEELPVQECWQPAKMAHFGTREIMGRTEVS